MGSVGRIVFVCIFLLVKENLCVCVHVSVCLYCMCRPIQPQVMKIKAEERGKMRRSKGRGCKSRGESSKLSLT